MIRKIVAIWVSLVMLFGFIVIIDTANDIIPTVKGTTLYVNTTGSGGAYTSIQDAINASSDGGTVFVYNGTYYENVLVNKTINLIGEDRNNTIIDGGGSEDVVRITADFVNLTEVCVTNSGNTDWDAGIELNNVQRCNIYCNYILNNYYGIYLRSSSLNINTENNITDNWYGIVLEWDSNNNNISNNNLLNHSIVGFYQYSSHNNIVSNNRIFKGHHGIVFWHSYENIITRNNVSNGTGDGIYVAKSNWNSIISNNISHTNWDGIDLYTSNKNNITHNKVLSSKGSAIFLGYSNQNKIAHNNISLNNSYGIRLTESNENNISANNVSDNNYGIYLGKSIDNIIYHNDFINNAIQGYDSTNSGNQWDNGYPLGGNFWSDYIGNDTLKGPNQDIPGRDGIGDTNYTIDSGSIDNYPLMEPYSFRPFENYTILKQGWNLISIPLIQTNQDLSKVLEMIYGYYDAIQWHDPTITNDLWKHYKVGKPYGNNLFELNETMGFWIHITQPGDTIFLYNGTQSIQNQTILLHPSWNMVGYPSMTSYNRTEGLNNLTFNDQVDAIWSYDAATQKWEEMGESDHFIIGRGYYIHAKSECEWEVPL